LIFDVSPVEWRKTLAFNLAAELAVSPTVSDPPDLGNPS